MFLIKRRQLMKKLKYSKPTNTKLGKASDLWMPQFLPYFDCKDILTQETFSQKDIFFSQNDTPVDDFLLQLFEDKKKESGSIDS